VASCAFDEVHRRMTSACFDAKLSVGMDDLLADQNWPTRKNAWDGAESLQIIFQKWKLSHFLENAKNERFSNSRICKSRKKSVRIL
jgi:hypothetical protein